MCLAPKKKKKKSKASIQKKKKKKKKKKKGTKNFKTSKLQTSSLEPAGVCGPPSIHIIVLIYALCMNFNKYLSNDRGKRTQSNKKEEREEKNKNKKIIKSKMKNEGKNKIKKKI